MAAPATEQDVCAYLQAQSLGWATPLNFNGAGAINLFASLVLPSSQDGNEGGVPAQAVFVAATGGPAPIPYLGRAGSYYQPTIQARIRSNPGDQAGGLALARLVRDALHEAVISGYVGALLEQPEPLPLGADGRNCYGWSVNVRLLRAG